MKIRDLATGNVFEAHEDAAKELLKRADYVKADQKEPVTAQAMNKVATKPKRRTTP
jgi:hypothetical protein